MIYLKTSMTGQKKPNNRFKPVPPCNVIIVALLVDHFYAMIFCIAVSLSGHLGGMSVFTVVNNKSGKEEGE
jgi:hypothetical protein